MVICSRLKDHILLQYSLDFTGYTQSSQHIEFKVIFLATIDAISTHQPDYLSKRLNF